ncbi:HAD-IA family hydrolase [Candidatus Beckwithbacteria bacterium]|nr:HAD-IA family hydrolase [Candidatus Beckwithbacteria bacterium]
MNSQVKFIYFDIGNVIASWRIAEKKLFELTDCDDFDYFMKVYQPADDDANLGKISTQTIWTILSKEFGLKDNFDFISWWAQNHEVIMPTHFLLQEIDKLFQIGFLTNIYPDMLEAFFKFQKIPKIKYRHAVQSSTCNVMKPDMTIYKKAAELASCPPQHILFIDDLEKNLQPARDLGWQTVCFDETNPEKSVEKIRAILNL